MSIGYVDPGNWATDLAAGAYGYRLLWVVLFASVTAMILQIAVVRLATLTGSDLASLASRRGRRGALALGAIFEGAVITADIAEFAGTAIGIRLLLPLPMPAAAAIALLAMAGVFLLNRGQLRGVETTLIVLLAIIAGAVGWQAARFGLLPRSGWADFAPQIPDAGAMLIAVGLIGATVMPHNLFLHSALVAKQNAGRDASERKATGRFYARETIVALGLATVVNLAILAIAAHLGTAGDTFHHAFAVIGSHWSTADSIVFGGALLVSGLASSVSATMSSESVIESFSPVPMPPMLRRAVAAIPATLVLCIADPMRLILWTQTALAFFLPPVLAVLLMELWFHQRGEERLLSTFSIVIAASAGALCVGFDAALIAFALR